MRVCLSPKLGRVLKKQQRTTIGIMLCIFHWSILKHEYFFRLVICIWFNLFKRYTGIPNTCKVFHGHNLSHDSPTGRNLLYVDRTKSPVLSSHHFSLFLSTPMVLIITSYVIHSNFYCSSWFPCWVTMALK
jgi:hypothetical protein